MQLYHPNGSRMTLEEFKAFGELQRTHQIPRAGTLAEISYCVLCGTSKDHAGRFSCPGRRLEVAHKIDNKGYRIPESFTDS